MRRRDNKNGGRGNPRTELSGYYKKPGGHEGYGSRGTSSLRQSKIVGNDGKKKDSMTEKTETRESAMYEYASGNSTKDSKQKVLNRWKDGKSAGRKEQKLYNMGENQVENLSDTDNIQTTEGSISYSTQEDNGAANLNLHGRVDEMNEEKTDIDNRKKVSYSNRVESTQNKTDNENVESVQKETDDEKVGMDEEIEAEEYSMGESRFTQDTRWSKLMLQESATALPNKQIGVHIKKEILDDELNNNKGSTDENSMSISSSGEESEQTFDEDMLSSDDETVATNNKHQKSGYDTSMSKRKSTAPPDGTNQKKLHTEEDSEAISASMTGLTSVTFGNKLGGIDHSSKTELKQRQSKVHERSTSDLEWEQIAKDIDAFDGKKRRN